MKPWLVAALLGVATIAAGSSAQANSPPIVAQVPPPPPPPPAVQKDGPFRLLVAARTRARHRREQGFHADVVAERGLWWVVFYR